MVTTAVHLFGCIGIAYIGVRGTIAGLYELTGVLLTFLGVKPD